MSGEKLSIHLPITPPCDLIAGSISRDHNACGTAGRDSVPPRLAPDNKRWVDDPPCANKLLTPAQAGLWSYYG